MTELQLKILYIAVISTYTGFNIYFFLLFKTQNVHLKAIYINTAYLQTNIIPCCCAFKQPSYCLKLLTETAGLYLASWLCDRYGMVKNFLTVLVQSVFTLNWQLTMKNLVSFCLVVDSLSYCCKWFCVFLTLVVWGFLSPDSVIIGFIPALSM